MRIAKSLIFIIMALFFNLSFAQDTGNFTQFFFNPYSLNPSFAGIDGRPAVFLGYRKQWSGIEGGPTISNFSFHTPLKAGLNVGMSAANDKRGILSNSGLLLSAAYSLPLGESNYLRFGLSAGGSFNTVDLLKISEAVLSDQALTNVLNKNTSIIGNAGISLHVKTFHIGVAMPNLFAPSYVSKDAFSITEVRAFEALVIHASNRFYFADNKHVFEPYFVYRSNTGLPSQYEVAGVLHLNHVLWIGGSLKQEFGISAFGGIKLNKSLALGGSYSLKNTGINELNFPTFEIQLSFLAGTSNSNQKSKSKTATHIPSYSFVDTEIKKLTAKEKLAEKRKDQEAAQKKQIELAKKQADQKKSQQEIDAALAKRNQDAIEAKKAQDAATAKRNQDAADAKKSQDAALAKKNQEAADARKAQDVALAKKIQEAEAQKAHDVLLAKEAEMKKVHAIEDEAKKTEALAKLHAEEEKSSQKQLDDHAHNPIVDLVDHHPDSLLPAANERHETHVQGNHAEELDLGNYVIVGAFSSGANAKKYAEGLDKLGFGGDYGHLSVKNLWYVFIFRNDDLEVTRQARDEFRNFKLLRSAWLLTVKK